MESRYRFFVVFLTPLSKQNACNVSLNIYSQYNTKNKLINNKEINKRIECTEETQTIRTICRPPAEKHCLTAKSCKVVFHTEKWRLVR